jgi:uncharacterized Zn-binding protein involved in type VI secretion
MPVSVKVNGAMNSIVHKGSNHFSAATIPDVCKTPSPGGPVPLPYPNVSQSATLAKGTTTVKADGMMIAIKGSEFSLSNGDEPGTLGGVKSSTFIKESTWILYSFDVKMDGKGACRLSDKKFQNHENTVDMMGATSTPVSIAQLHAECQDIATKCDAKINRSKAGKGRSCRVRGIMKHKCCQDALNAKKAADPAKYQNVFAEYKTKKYRLDVCVRANGKYQHIFDYKFRCGKNKRKPKMSKSQKRAYKCFNCPVTLIGP